MRMAKSALHRIRANKAHEEERELQVEKRRQIEHMCVCEGMHRGRGGGLEMSGAKIDTEYCVRNSSMMRMGRRTNVSRTGMGEQSNKQR